MTEKELDNELKYLEISVEKLKRMINSRKRERQMDYQSNQCADSDVMQVCSAIRKSSLMIKKHAHLVGRFK